MQHSYGLTSSAGVEEFNLKEVSCGAAEGCHIQLLSYMSDNSTRTN